MSKHLQRTLVAIFALTGLFLGTLRPAFAAEPSLTGLVLTPGTIALTADQGATFSLMGTYSDGTTATVTEQATWQTNGAGFSGIPGQKGNFLATATGTWTVSAAVNGLSASAVVTITHGVPVGLTLMPTPGTVTTDHLTPLRLFAHDADGNGWEVTNVASWTTNEVNGIISAAGYQAKTPGTWTVTATLGTLTVTRTFVVTAGSLQTIQVLPSTIETVALGKTLQLQANAYDKNGNLLVPIITWSVTNPNIGSITSEGVFTAEGAGQTNIIATAAGVQEIIPIIVRDTSVAVVDTDPQIVAVARPTTTVTRTPRVAADEVEKEPEVSTQTPAGVSTQTEAPNKNMAHPWVIVLLLAHAIVLVAYFGWLIRKPLRWWWALPIVTTAALLAVYSTAFTEGTYLWWPWTIIGISIIFISVYYQRYGPEQTNAEGPPGAPDSTQK